MKFGKITIQPRTRIFGVDVRWFFVWLEKVDAWRSNKKRQQLLHIHDATNKGD